MIDQEWVQANLARVRAPAWSSSAPQLEGRRPRGRREHVNPADASSIKVFGTEFFTNAYRLLMESSGRPRRCSPARRPPRSPAASTGAQGSLILTFGGGVTEISAT